MIRSSQGVELKAVCFGGPPISAAKRLAMRRRLARWYRQMSARSKDGPDMAVCNDQPFDYERRTIGWTEVEFALGFGDRVGSIQIVEHKPKHWLVQSGRAEEIG